MSAAPRNWFHWTDLTITQFINRFAKKDNCDLKFNLLLSPLLQSHLQKCCIEYISAFYILWIAIKVVNLTDTFHSQRWTSLFGSDVTQRRCASPSRVKSENRFEVPVPHTLTGSSLGRPAHAPWLRGGWKSLGVFRTCRGLVSRPHGPF